MKNLNLIPREITIETMTKGMAIPPTLVKALVIEEANYLRYQGIVDGHRVSLVINSTQGGSIIESHCTCGEAFCEHMAAIILNAQKDNTNKDVANSLHSQMTQQKTSGLDTSEQNLLEPRIKQWLASFEQISDEKNQRGKQYEIRYVLDMCFSNTNRKQAGIQFSRVPMRAGVANLAAAEPYKLFNRNSILPQFVMRDQKLLDLLQMVTEEDFSPGSWLDVVYTFTEHPANNLLITNLVETQRFCWKQVSQVLQLGDQRQGQPYWFSNSAGEQTPTILVDGLEDAVILPISPPWAIDEQSLSIFPITVDTPPKILDKFLSGPRLNIEQARALAKAMRKPIYQTHLGNLPLPHTLEIIEKNLPFTPKLVLSGHEVADQKRSILPVARFYIGYGGLYLDKTQSQSQEKTVSLKYSDKIIRTQRNIKAEKDALRQIKFSDLMPLEYFNNIDGISEDLLILENDSEASWMSFLQKDRFELENSGIEVEIDPSFPLRFAEVDDWYGETTDGLNGWFNLDLGIVVDGKPQSLLPLLTSLIASNPELFTPESLNQLNDEQIIFVKLADGRRVPLPAGRIKAIISVLVELNLPNVTEGPLSLPLLDAARLAVLDDALKARWVGADKLLEFGRRLQSFEQIGPVELPKKLKATLRPYQEQGLAWLQFLREYEMGGILADDMGLGKTLQTLAHIQLEKESGRADLPSLVVVPTSVLGNWQREAQKFTPELKFLKLHGQERKEQFDQIAQADVILTTYPLLPRDLPILEKQEYHLLILDEAQNIKNAKTAAAKAASSLTARHRLCLTGTPLENHLGELWSQFSFLSPGLLYDEKTFRDLYRNPIEKRGDEMRQKALAARIKPFVLRREKQQVVKELPPKTEIPVRVLLEGDQRDLYETVRVTMESRVREELEAHGLARSTIAILDALLKLRQSVTDPRLVKLTAASQVKNNAKLIWLQQNLPKMLEEGRRVLLFSSFATLLGHLEGLLIALQIPYSKITGQTRDRQQQIDAFQMGQTHVFLITLKAGGVGLNLTAADTVIHYDPWWNPAAEDQATDRAYRIGQDKPVFVYKLIASGSVEERILEMQSRKATLAKSVLDGGLSSSTQLTMNDLNNLLAPLDN